MMFAFGGLVKGMVLAPAPCHDDCCLRRLSPERSIR